MAIPSVKIDIEVITGAAKAALRGLEKQAKLAQKRFDKMTGGIRKVAKGFALLGTAIAGVALFAVTKALTSFISGSIEAAKSLEVLAVQFEVLTGSAVKARETMEELEEFSASTPFQLEDLAKATAKLIGFGFEADEATEKLQVLGDVASSSGSNIQEISLIFGQVSAAGKLTGERLLQLQERAIPIGPAIAKTMGIAESAVRDAVSKGKVDFKTFEKAFDSLNDKGQFAFDGMAKASRTLQGRISTLGDNFKLLQKDVGDKLLPGMKAFSTALTSMIGQLRKSNEFKEFLDRLGKNIPNAIATAVDSFIVFNSLVGATLTTLTTLSAGIGSIIKSFIDIRIKALEAGKAIDGFLGGSYEDEYNAQIDGLKGMADGIENFSVEALEAGASIEKFTNDVNDAITKGGGIILKVYNEEIAKINELAAATEDGNKRKVTSVEELTAAELEAIRLKVEAEKKLVEELYVLRDQLKTQREASRLLEAEQDTIFKDERLLRLQTFFSLEEQAEIQANLNRAKNAAEGQKIIYKAQIDGQKRKRKAITKQNRWENMTEKQQQTFLIQSTGRMFGGLAALAAQGGAKMFKITKALRIGEVVMNTISAIQASAAIGYPQNIPGIIAETARGAASLAAITKQKPPSFQEGGIVPGSSFSGDNVTANINSGEMILNREHQANLFSLAQTGGGVTQTNITVELDGEVVGRAVSMQVADGLVLGEIA